MTRTRREANNDREMGEIHSDMKYVKGSVEQLHSKMDHVLEHYATKEEVKVIKSRIDMWDNRYFKISLGIISSLIVWIISALVFVWKLRLSF